MNYRKIKEIICNYSERSKYYEKDFFPNNSIKTKEGRFELLALSILDVRGFNADDLWYIVGKNLRKRNILDIKFLLNSSEAQIKRELIIAKYNRGKNYTAIFAKLLKKIAKQVKDKYNGDISEIFNKHKTHDKYAVDEILKELDKLAGIGKKIATMYFKFMVATFKIWKWKKPESLIGVAIPDDFQVRKVFIRLGHLKTNRMAEQYSVFSHRLKLPFMEIDDVLWNVGRIFCSKRSPSCHYCPFLTECNYAKIRKSGNVKKMDSINKMID